MRGLWFSAGMFVAFLLMCIFLIINALSEMTIGRALCVVLGGGLASGVIWVVMMYTEDIKDKNNAKDNNE